MIITILIIIVIIIIIIVIIIKGKIVTKRRSSIGYGHYVAPETFSFSTNELFIILSTQKSTVLIFSRPFTACGSK